MTDMTDNPPNDYAVRAARPTLREAIEALRDGCSLHHLPLVNGWAHQTHEYAGSERVRTVTCRLSELDRQGGPVGVRLRLTEAGQACTVTQ